MLIESKSFTGNKSSDIKLFLFWGYEIPYILFCGMMYVCPAFQMYGNTLIIDV